MTDERYIDYDDLEAAQTDVLIVLPYEELENYIRESRAMIDNSQMLNDRLRAVRMEKIRRECASGKAGDA